jgi:hypothetical protein
MESFSGCSEKMSRWLGARAYTKVVVYETQLLCFWFLYLDEGMRHSAILGSCAQFCPHVRLSWAFCSCYEWVRTHVKCKTSNKIELNWLLSQDERRKSLNKFCLCQAIFWWRLISKQLFSPLKNRKENGASDANPQNPWTNPLPFPTPRNLLDYRLQIGYAGLEQRKSLGQEEGKLPLPWAMHLHLLLE